MRELNLTSNNGKFPSFDPVWETAWKIRVEQEISELKQKVLRLETGVTNHHYKEAAPAKLEQTNQPTRELNDFDICCVRLIKSKPVATLQGIWLFICILSFLIFAQLEFLKAKDNDEAEWKPEKKTSTVDYRLAANVRNYQIPYIFLYFRVALVDGVGEDEASDVYWTEEQIDSILSQINDTQIWSLGKGVKIGYVDENFIVNKSTLYFEEVRLFYSESSIQERSFGAVFRLKLKALQEPEMFRLDLPFLAFNQTLNGITIKFNGFYIGISRDKDRINFAELVNVPIENIFRTNSKIIYNLGYTEKVINTLESNEPTWYIGTQFEGREETVSQREYGFLQLRISTSLLVEIWDQYIEYGYTDWISAMGGILSITSVVFFWGAYFLARMFTDHEGMGILPSISMIFSNYKDIRSIEDLMKKDSIFPDVTKDLTDC